MPSENTQFKKGQSGNPSGRPKGSRNRQTIVREILEKVGKYKDPTNSDWFNESQQEMSRYEAMVLALTAKAMKGDLKAFRELNKLAYGTDDSEPETL